VRDQYGYLTWIDKNISKGDTLAYTFVSKTIDIYKPIFKAILWNTAFSNRVVYVKAGSYNDWIKKLEKNNVTHILIKTESQEEKWIDFISSSPGWMGLSDRFRVVYSDDSYKILKVKRRHE
jgi:hypothetical protein